MRAVQSYPAKYSEDPIQNRQWSVRIWWELGALTIPVLVGNILQQTYNLVDTILVGYYLGERAFSALGIAGTISNLLLFLIFGCCTGIGVVVAELYGKKDYPTLRKALHLSALLGGVFTLLISALSAAFLPSLLFLLATPQALKPYVTEYVHIIQLFLVVTFSNNGLFSVLRAISDAKSATLFLAISMLSNIVLDVVCIGTLGMGIAGAAYATILAQAISVYCSLLHIVRKKRFLLGKESFEKADIQLLRKIGSYSFVSALHMSSLYVGRMLVQGIVNTVGMAEISAFTAASRIESLAQAVSTSVAEGLGLYIAQNRGAGDRSRIRKGLQVGGTFLTAGGMVVSLIMVFAPAPLIQMMLKTASAQTLLAGSEYFRMVGYFYTLCFLGNLFLGYCRGSGQVTQQFFITTTHLTVRIIIAYSLAETMGLRAVALGTGIGWIVMIGLQLIEFSRCRKHDPLLSPARI